MVDPASHFGNITTSTVTQRRDDVVHVVETLRDGDVTEDRVIVESGGTTTVEHFHVMPPARESHVEVTRPAETRYSLDRDPSEITTVNTETIPTEFVSYQVSVARI